MFLRITCLKFTCSVVQFALCMHCARLLYKLHVNNGEIEVGPDFRQVPTGFVNKVNDKVSICFVGVKKARFSQTGFFKVQLLSIPFCKST